MNLKSIVAVASGEATDAALLSVSAKLAGQFGGQVRVVPAFADHAASLAYYGVTLGAADDDPIIARIAASERETQEGLEDLARDVAAREQLSADRVSVDKRALQPAIALAPAAVLSDIVAFSAPAARDALNGLFAETLLSTRASCLLVNGAAAVQGPVAVAWDGSGQAGRALRAAMPLLQAAPSVVILHNADDRAAPEAKGAGPEEARAYLARHGVANVTLRTLHGDNVAASLLGGAKAERCGLLVAGAYGRPRLYELVLGGTTRALVNAQDAPHLLLAH